MPRSSLLCGVASVREAVQDSVVGRGGGVKSPEIVFVQTIVHMRDAEHNPYLTLLHGT